MKNLTVTTPMVESGSYDIQIGTNILGSVWGELCERFGASNILIVTDSNVAKHDHIYRLLGEETAFAIVIDPPGEVNKTINTVVDIVEYMEKASMGRDSAIVAVGGGTVGDMAGFAASIFKRGVPVIHIPTTTVSQADSSIGGKTGVDSSLSKNAFGTFWQPEGVYIDVATLDTLDDRQYRAGLVESVKHALICDSDYFDYLEANIDMILGRDYAVLEELAFRNCKIKASVVQKDPREKNLRRTLNYGHTIGHAVESVSNFELLHGEAVAIGIVAAGLIELEMGLAKDETRLERIKAVLRKIEQPLVIPAEQSKERILDLLTRDKKAVGKWPRFALIEEIGKSYCKDGQWAHEVSQELVEKVIDKLR